MVRALYGLAVSGWSFEAFLSKNLKELGYVPSKVDTDVYMRAAVKPNGNKYYEYLIAYVDDIATYGINPLAHMDAIKKRFKLKDRSVKEPKLYVFRC